MTTISIQIPDDVLGRLHQTPDEFAAELRLAAAIHWFQQERMSRERAAEIAGVDLLTFLQELARRDIDVLTMDDEDVTAETPRA